MRPILLCILFIFGLSTAANAQQLKEITNSIGMKLVLIHAGSFTMGSPDGEIGRQDNEMPHEVTISKSYYLGVYEVTQDQYERVMGKNPSSFKGPKNPAEMVSWDDAISYCTKLSGMPEEEIAGRVYRLPTEAEWEYACRSTSTTSYCFGDPVASLFEYCWSMENSDKQPLPVGEKKANRWGLHDMYGNVFELCQDVESPYPSEFDTDPIELIRGTFRVLRGGSCVTDAEKCRSASRYGQPGPIRGDDIGFRVAMSLPSKKSQPPQTK